MAGAIVGRKQALENKLPRYFTGKTCKHGHVSERITVNGNCVTCSLGRQRANYQSHAEERRAAQNARNAKCRDQCRERYRSWREKNVEAARANSRQYAKAHPEYRRAIKLRRRARKAAAEGSHTTSDLKCLMGLQKGRCALCSEKLSLGYHVDHIVALSNGGGNDRMNLQLLCPDCNWRKGAKDPIQFAQENQRLL